MECVCQQNKCSQQNIILGLKPVMQFTTLYLCVPSFTQSDPLRRSLFGIPHWFKASAAGNAQVCHSSRRPCTQPPMPVSQPTLRNPQRYTALCLRFDGVLGSRWDEVTSAPQTVLRHRKAVGGKIKPSGFLHPVSQVVINTLWAGCCRSTV